MDVQITHNGTFFDLSLSGADLAIEDGLQTAVIISLFTDRRAEDGDELPDGTTDRRGWWGDAYAQVDNDRIGSKLWLLSRSKQTAETARLAQTYASEALQWLIDDGIADRVDVTTEWVSKGILGLKVVIYRPDLPPLEFTFNNLWEAMNVL